MILRRGGDGGKTSQGGSEDRGEGHAESVRCGCLANNMNTTVVPVASGGIESREIQVYITSRDPSSAKKQGRVVP